MSLFESKSLNEMNKMFEELVPISGPAETKAGELVRAVSRICYRWYNDGDWLGVGYGNETCNPAARYIQENYPDTELDAVVDALWGARTKTIYENGLILLVDEVVDYLKQHPELKDEKNEDDMWNYRRPEDVAFEEEDDDDWEDEEEEEDEYEYVGPCAVYDPED